jgi:hypothetical protein
VTEAVRVPPCDLCGRMQTVLGACLYGPPDSEGRTLKSHVCTLCYEKIVPKSPEPPVVCAQCGYPDAAHGRNIYACGSYKPPAVNTPPGTSV